jgi:hypothetical protein
VPLSEDEQRILNEMEQKLFENDRHFAHRVNSPRVAATRAGGLRPKGVSYRAAVLLFAVGFIVLLISFRSSIMLATFGFFLMFVAALMVERRVRAGVRTNSGTGTAPSSDGTPGGADVGDNLRRFRSRFWQQH